MRCSTLPVILRTKDDPPMWRRCHASHSRLLLASGLRSTCRSHQLADLEYEVATIKTKLVELAVARRLSGIGQVGHFLLKEQAKLGPGDVSVVVGIGIRFLARERVKEKL